jgi:hypothetical protein
MSLTKIKPSNITATGVSAGSYTAADITVNSSGQITGAASNSVVASGGGGGPKITGIQVTDNSYSVLDDTAVDVLGGYIKITGSGFASGCLVYFNQTPAASVSFVSGSELLVTTGALLAGTYVLYAINTDGGVAISVPGVTFSATPSWQTASTLPDQYDNTPITLSLVAGQATSYTLTSGNLPPGLSLNTSTGAITGTVTTVTVDTSYTFTVRATDAQNQDSPRTFTITITVSDPYFKLTTLLLGGEQGNTVIKDSSTNNFNLTVAGDARASNFTPYGTGWSNYFDGSGDYLDVGSNAALGFGTGDFTIEAWIYRSASGSFPIYTNGPAANGSFAFYIVSDKMQTDYYGGTSLIGTTTLPVNTWTHVAVVRFGSTLSLYLNGNRDATTTTSSNNTSNNGVVGRNWTNLTTYTNGYISNLRVVKDTAVYSGTSYTVPIAPLTAISNTSLLTCQSNRFVDNSTNNFVITKNGDVAVRSFNPFGITNTGDSGSMYFDGTGDYLQVPYNSNLQLSASDFTIEFWFYGTVTQNNADVFLSGYSSATNLNYLISVPAGNDLKFYASTTGTSWTLNALTIGTLITGQWNHIAVTRSGSTVTTYLNGIVGGTSTVLGSNAIFANTIPVTIATAGDGLTNYNVTGYFSDLRIIKGTAITPLNNGPTQPLTAVANTQLLTLQYRQPHNNHGFQDSSSNQFLITRNGNASQGTFSPFSQTGWSYYVPEQTSNHVNFTTSAGTDFQFAGDFTIEGWVYPQNNSGDGSLFVVSDNTNYLTINISISANVCNLYFNNSSPTAITSDIPLATWTHVAMVRNGSATGNIKLYINGVLKGSVTNTSTLGYANPALARIGGGVAGINRYYSNVRVCKSAVYTTAFTPSTLPLTTTSQNATNCVLLTANSNRFLNQAAGATATITGTPSVVAFSPFAPTQVYSPATNGGSAYFDGTGDYFTVASPNNWTFMHSGLVSWTLSGVIYRNTATEMQLFSTNANSINGYQGMNVAIGSSGNIGVSYTAGSQGYRLDCSSNASGLFPVGAWTTFSLSFNHLAAQGSRLSVIVNGVSYTSFTEQTIVNDANNGATFAFSTASPSFTAHIGSFIGSISGTGSFINGYLTNYKIVAGNATIIELNFTDAAILDRSSRNILETMADAKTSSVQVKYGTGAMYFDGTGDYLRGIMTPLLTNLIGASSPTYTIEAWIYPITTSGYQRIIDFAGANTAGFPFVDLVIHNGVLKSEIKYTTGGAATTISGGTISANTWAHTALVVNNGTAQLYLNGSAVGSTATFNALSGMTGVGIGGPGNTYAVDYFSGYIDDVRITQFARYTSNFTAPTAAHRLK